MARLQLKCFEQEAVVFDTASGDTHYLSPLAYALYKLSRDQPGTKSYEVMLTLAQLFGVQPDADFQRLTVEAMYSLQHIGLLDTQ